MCIPYVHHEELMSLDITPNSNSYSRLFPILLDRSSLYHMTSRSCALHPLQTNNNTIYLCPANPNPSQSLSTLLSYNIYHHSVSCYNTGHINLWISQSILFYITFVNFAQNKNHCLTIDGVKMTESRLSLFYFLSHFLFLS